MILKNRIFILLVLAITFILLMYLIFLNKTTTTSELEYRVLDRDLLKFRNHLPQKLLNLSFRYTLNNEYVCDNRITEEILAIFIVTSYFGNMETRNSMRQAFSSGDLKYFKLRRVFLLGEAPEDKYTTQLSVIDESKQFNDIIQGNFSEAYRNLTYKHIMGLKWASTFCSSAKYIIKMDDDTVINLYRLEDILNSFKSLKKDFIAGYVLRNLRPIRESSNKWYVSKEEYSLSRYPSFVSGWFYVTTPHLARNIVALAQYEKYFWIDDLFVTGILAKKLKIKQYDISKFFTVNSEFLQCCIQDFEKYIDCDISIGPNGGNKNMFFEFNSKVKMCSIKKCTKRTKPIEKTCVAEKKINLGRGNPIVTDFRL